MSIVVGLDIGTTKVVCLIAEQDDNGVVSVLAKGEAKSEGMRKGSVVNIESTSKAIQSAISQAEKLAGVDVRDVVVGVSGDHVESLLSNGMVTISGANKVVTQEDVTRVIEAAKTINIPSNREVIHVVPLNYSIEETEEIIDPIGMSGGRLSVNILLVTAAKSSLQNLRNSVAKAGFNITDFVLQPYASSHAILKDVEREMGVCLIDIGGGTTDIAMYRQSSLRATAVVSVGGVNVTNDLSVGLRTPMENAESIKTNYGVAHISMVREDRDSVEVPAVGGKESARVSRKIVSQIIQPRLEELFEMVYREISFYTESINKDVDKVFPAGAVLTGGASKLPGIAQLAQSQLGLPVKIGEPIGITGLVDVVSDPKYATVVGLLKYTYAQHENNVNYTKKSSGSGINAGQIISRFKSWLDDVL